MLRAASGTAVQYRLGAVLQSPLGVAMSLSSTAQSLPLVLHALAFAANKHRDQRRKDPQASPYINHPIALANVLINEGGVLDAQTLCAAVLHDTVEDTETTPDELA